MIETGILLSAGQRFRIADLPEAAGEALARLPWIHRVLLENLLRRSGGDKAVADALPAWLKSGHSEAEVPFYPGRVLMHDTTCGPALVDLAAARQALADAGGDPTRINPVLPVDVSTDHSVGVDFFGSPDALKRNMEKELGRNRERFGFMKWATRALANVTVHPPGTGIMHTLNLERLATVITTETRDGEAWAVPDTLIGTDSHTPMINGIGILAWGVGGLEAESVMMGMPVMMRVPEVVGVKLTGRLRDGVLATDLVLTVTQVLRGIDLADRFVEFFGPGVSTLSAGERSVVANMAPEYGANSGFFPIDGRTLDYLAATGRPAEQVALVKDYAQRQKLWFDPAAEPVYHQIVEIDLGSVGISVAGPRRPQDLMSPTRMREFGGKVAIAAITSCTNTSDPRLILAAGLLARKARKAGLTPPSWVKTSFAPGSPTADRYLRRSGLLADLEGLGFGIVGYGCTTCNGNSGALTKEMEEEVAAGASPVAVLSGNRNFPGRVHGQVDKAFLASPPLVIAYALAGHADLDILSDPIGRTADGADIRLSDLWPSEDEIDSACAQAADISDFRAAYDKAESSEMWERLEAPQSVLYPWEEDSTYLRLPPFAAFRKEAPPSRYFAHPILVLGDDVTTDHISPAGNIPARSEAADYLAERGEDRNDLNVFASRRGNWEVMLRGLFANKAVRNLLDDTIPPGQTIHAPSGETMPLWQAAERYKAAGEAVVLVAGDRYGMGSSRDWAAKGLGLLSVRAVLATGFERIHRSNLVNMGILPLLLPADRHPNRLALRPGDRIEIDATQEAVVPHAEISVAIHRAGGQTERFTARAAIETGLESRILSEGGMIPMILRQNLN